MEDEICPYATFHLLGFREEMDPSKAMQFQTFPHPGNGHSGTMGPPVGHPTNASAHSRSGSQSMVFLFYISHPRIPAASRTKLRYRRRAISIRIYLAVNVAYVGRFCSVGIKSIDRFRSHVRTAAILGYRPKAAAAVPTTFSHPSTTTRLIARPRKTSTDRSTDSMAHHTIITDLAVPWDVAA